MHKRLKHKTNKEKEEEKNDSITLAFLFHFRNIFSL